ncbi:replication initiation protein [Jeotgalibaca dankookensis]|uniref:replication initiation protein n=1 Tax=Jeotgalibaca dankookensis TaxID=708126 RepID=UPI0007815CDA|nr:replication initiation protein [Jeotgalibaca dankookensis]
MANEVVKHHNDLNTIPMRKWSKEEMDFFFAIIAKLRDEGTKEITFDKRSLAELANYSIRTNKAYEQLINQLSKNILDITYLEKKRTTLNGKPAYLSSRMNLFSRFDSKWTEDLSELEITVKVSDEFEYVLNQLNSEFTSYELAEFTQIRSTYAKTLYRLLKQWRTVGKKEFQIDEFKRLLDTPDYYTPSEINKNVLNYARKELPQFFPNLKIKPIKSNKRGTPVIAYEFTWLSEKTGTWIENKYDQQAISPGKRVRKEKLPDWAKENYVQPEEVMLPKEKQDEFSERLARIHAKKEKK